MRRVFAVSFAQFALFVTAAIVLLGGCDSKNPVQPVVTVPLNSLTLSVDFDTLRIGQIKTFTATAVDTGGNVVASPSLSWSSGNTSVFIVGRGTGNVRGIGEGTAWLYVTSAGKIDSALIVVLPATRGWFVQTSHTAFDLNDVFVDPAGNWLWLVGESGRIQVSTNAGEDWFQQTSGTANSLNGVWFTSISEGWAVGGAGTVRRTTNGGIGWTNVLVGTGEALNDVFFADADHGWIVGSNGVIAKTRNRGATWTLKFPTTFTLRGVAFSDTAHGWAVGDGGVIVGTHDGGNSWYLVQPAVTAQALRSVSRWFVAPPPAPSFRSPSGEGTQSLFDFAVAVGNQGTVARAVAGADSADWVLAPNAGALNSLYDVQLVNGTTGWAVGTNGTAGLILNTVNGGTSWTPQTSNTQFQLNGVYFIDAYRGWAVGNNGALLHTVTGGQP
jgi:photosystem II stability/assembly factor-like uncharacterized protein